MGTFSSISKAVSGEKPFGKTPYQANTANPATNKKQEEDRTSTAYALSNIYDVYQTNPERGTQLANEFHGYQLDRSTPVYNPFIEPTNPAVAQMQELGFDVSNLDDAWFEKNSWLKQYYVTTDNTNNLSSTMTNKKASNEQRAAYAFNQLDKQRETTAKAKSESAALTEELGYMANDPNHNYSDDYIISHIDWKKYPTLAKMKETAAQGTPLELNSPVEMATDDWMHGVLWAARNDGGTGYSNLDIVRWYQGEGKQWTDDPEINAKLNKNDLNTYNPYSVGMTLGEEGRYFDMYSFTQEDIDRIGLTLDWDDKTASDMIQKVQKAEDFTVKAEGELDKLNQKIDAWVKAGTSEERIKKNIDNYMSENCPSLLSMDKSLKSRELIGTTRKIDYRYDDMIRKMYDDCAERDGGPSAYDEVTGTVSSATGNNGTSDVTANSTIKAQDTALTDANSVLGDDQTSGESAHMTNAGTVAWSGMVDMWDGLKDAVAKEGSSLNEEFFNNQIAETNSQYTKSAFEASRIINDYENTEKRYEQSVQKYGELSGLYGDFEYVGKELSPAPTITVPLNGKEVQIMLQKDMQTGEYVFGSAGYIDHLNLVTSSSNRFYDQIGSKEDFDKIVNDTVKHYNDYAKKVQEVNSRGIVMSDEDKGNLEQLYAVRAQMERDADYLKAHKSEYDDAVKTEQKARDSFYRSYSMLNDLGVATDGGKDHLSLINSATAFGKKPPKEKYAYSDVDMLDEAMRGTVVTDANGKKAIPHEAMDYVTSQKAEDQEQIKDIQYMLDYFGEDLPQEYRSNMQAQIASLEQDIKEYDYFLLQTNDDWEELVAKGEALDPQTHQTIKAMYWDNMTQEEKDRYHYLLARDGRDAAAEYYQYLSGDGAGKLAKRQTQDLVESARLATQENPFLANYIAVATSPLSSVGSLISLIYTAATGESAGDTPFMMFNNIANAVNEETTMQIQNAYKDNPTAQKIVQGVYEIAYNRGRSVMNALSFPFLGAFGEFVGALPMATTAMADEVMKAKEAGAEDWQAWTLGAVALLCEAGTEMIELGDIKQARELGLNPLTGIKDFLKQYPIAGFSEALGESLNDILEGVADYLVLGDEGEFNERVWNYQTTMGLSKEDAEAMAIKDEIYNVLHTAVISYLSPGLDVFSFASGKVALYNHYNRQANQYNTSVRDIRSNEQVKAQYAEESGSIESKINNGEVPTIDFGKLDALDKDYISSMETLESAKGKHRVTTRSSAIASALKTDNTPESADVANAAAVNADNTFGDGVSEIQTIFDGGRRAGLDINQIRKGIQYATLAGENSASSQLVQSDEFKNATPDRKAEMLIEAASLDDQNQGVQQTVADNVYENRIAEKEKELRANGSMNGTVKAADEAMKASAETQQARDDLETKQAETEAAVQANQAAVNAVNENASKDNLDQVEKTAVEVGQRDESAQQYEQHLNKTQEAEAQKKEDLKTIKQQEKSSERQQAEQMLAEEDKQREADKKQAEQQKIANENATEANEEIVSEQETAADREARIRQRLQEANYTGEDLERQVRRIMDYAEQKSRKKVDTKARLSDADGDKFLRTISRHTGVTYEMQDLGDPLKTRGYIIDRNHIVLNSRLTRGQALVEAALHEYTHGAEGTKAYEKYANFVINAMYANKQSQYEEDLKTKMRENASLWKDLSYEEKRTRARQELVADYARLNLAKKEFIRGITAQGLGGKFREYLSNAISLLKGYTLDAEGRAKYQELRTAMKLFKEAIDERARHTEQSNNGHTGLIQASISGWTDATGLTLEVTDDDNHVYKLYSNGTEIKPGEYKADMVNGTPVGNLISMAAKTRIETLTNKLERGKITQDQFDKQLSEISKTASQQREYVAQIINMIGQYQDAAMVWELAGSLAFSSLKTNGDPQYSDSYDFGTICTKTQAILNAISQTQVDLGRALTKEEIDGIVYEEVGKGVQKDGKWIHGATPCPPCYVYATWVNKPARLEMVRQFQNEMSGWTNEQINEFMNRPEPVGKTKSETTQLTKDQNSRKLWISLCLADQVKDNETGETRWVRKENPDICPNDILLDLRRSGDMATQHPGTWTFMQKGGNAQGKAIAPYSGARLGETIVGKAIGAGELNARLLEDERNAGNEDYIPQFLNPFLSSDEADQAKAEEYFKKAIQKIKAQNLKGGQRWQSWSDFRAEWGSDYLMEMITMQALGSQVQTYTKVVEALDLLASAGFEVNMSLMPYGDGFWHNEDGSIKIDEDGNLMLRFSPVTGINPEAAEEYAKKYGEKGNVQPMVVGISDEHIKAALAGNYITFVIPFHGSGGSVKRLQHLMSLLHEQMESGNDYTKAQSDTFETGKTNTNPTWLLREKILTGECENATDEELDAIYANEFLTKLYEDRYINEDSDAFGVYFSKGEAQQIYPYEYWDTNTTLATADINSQRFIDYCQMMGVVPRFSGLTKSDGTEYANFSGRSVDENGNVTYNPVKGYWKLLIDRSMYNRVYDENGKIIPEKCTYHKPQAVSTADINVGAMPMAANNTVGHSDDDTREITERIVQRVQMKNGQNAAAGSAVDLQQNANTINNVIHEGSEVQNSSLSDLSESEMDDIIRVTDEHYERAVENGDMEEAQRLVDQKAEESGYTIKVYHGTANGGHFTIFDPKKLNNSKLSSYIGQGFYFTNSESGAREYMKNSDINGRLTAGRDSHLFKGYIKLQNPIEITEDSHNIPYDVVRSIIADGDKAWFFDKGIAHDLQGTEINGQKYTKEEISSMNRDEKIDLYTQHLIENGDRYALQHMVDAYSYGNQDLLLEAMKNYTGNDGIHWQMQDGLDQFVVFDSSQFKESDPVTYDDDGNVIPLSERFSDSEDIRYSQLSDLSDEEINQILAKVESNGMTDEEKEQLAQERTAAYSSVFNKQYDSWDQKQTGISFDIGETPQVLKESGVPDYKIKIPSDTILHIWKWHFEMDGDKIKQLPIIINHPILSVWSNDIGGRILLFGEIGDKNGDPLMVVMEGKPTYDKFTKSKFLQITNAYIKDDNPSEYVNKRINNGKLIYVDMKRVGELPGGLRLQLPSTPTSTNSDEQKISQNGDSVNIQNSMLGDLSETEMDMILNDIDSEESKLPGPPTTLPGIPVGKSGSAQRQFGSKTAQESDALHQEVKDYLYTHSDYTPDSNRDQINRAMDWVRSKANESDPDGYRAALEEVLDPSFDYRSADGQARMLTVMSMAALKARDGDQSAMADELRLADAYNQQGTDLGRQLQARKIFRLMTPLGRRMSLQQEVTRINQEYMNNGKDTRVSLPEWILTAAEEAQTEEDFEKVRKAAEKELAKQMPANWKEKIRTWRMLSMLANTRTHIRNILGNAIFMPTVGLKNAIGTGLENVFVKEGGERTKAIRYTDDAKAFAKEDVKRMQDMLTGEAKYSPEGRIDQNKKAFGQGKGILSRTIGKGVQAVADANSWALEKEDWIFLSKHYRNALASYMTANGLTSADMKGSTLEKARNYAVLEAQKATYRDANAVSTWLNKASRRGGIGGFLVDTVLPFKKTPANILRRGIEYSPVGLLHSLATARKSLDLYESWTANGRKGAMPKGAKSMTEVLDKISSGMTGTMIAGLGALGYALGAVKLGFGGDDDDELEKERGSQEYSIELFGHSFTIDWAAPVCMPFFTGAALYKEFSEMGEVDDVDDVAGMVGKFINSLSSISEPVFNLSMLDGVSSLLKSASSTQKDKIPIFELLQNIGANYVGSLVPSASGALARTIDTTRRQNYVEPGDPLRIWKQKIEQAENKIPWLSMRNIPYRDVWGEADVSAPVEAFLENFILPGYLNKMSDEKLTQELQRVYDQTGAASVIPKTASKTVGTKKLTDQEYDKYVVTRGQTAKQLLNDLIGRDEFIALTPTDQSEGNPEAQVNLIGEVWKYANAVARHEIDPTYTMDKWIASAYADGDPVGMIFAREEEKAQKAYGAQMKTDLFTAITGQDAEAIGACLEGMKQAGEDNKSIRTSVMNNFRDQYKEAYRNGDQETMDAIMYGMLYLDLEDQSFTDEDDPKSIFNTWKKSVDKGE